MDNNSKALKGFMQQHFDFSTFKKAGIYPKEMKHTDYVGQAAIICNRLGLDNIFDYAKYEIRCHISYAGERPMNVNAKGELQTIPFVEVINKNSLGL